MIFALKEVPLIIKFDSLKELCKTVASNSYLLKYNLDGEHSVYYYYTPMGEGTSIWYSVDKRLDGDYLICRGGKFSTVCSPTGESIALAHVSEDTMLKILREEKKPKEKKKKS